MTNFEKIRAMSVEELAKFLDHLATLECGYGCKDCPFDIVELECDTKIIERWLNMEVEE